MIYFSFKKEDITNCFTLTGSTDVLTRLELSLFANFWNLLNLFRKGQENLNLNLELRLNLSGT